MFLTFDMYNVCKVKAKIEKHLQFSGVSHQVTSVQIHLGSSVLEPIIIYVRPLSGGTNCTLILN